jgi:hypothetical protein
VASIYGASSVTYGDDWQLRLDYTITQDEKNNKSQIACTLYLKAGSDGRHYNLSGDSAYYVICGEKTYKPYDFDGTAWYKLGSRTIKDIKHEDDGKKSYKLSASWVSDNKTYYTPASISLSETIELPQINRGLAWVKTGGAWKRAFAWVNVNGTWKRAIPFVNKSGVWKRSV